MNTTDQEREKFEATYLAIDPLTSTRETAWICWQAALAQQSPQAEPVAWRKTERMYHDYEGSAKEDREGFLTTRFSESRQCSLEGWEPLYASPQGQGSRSQKMRAAGYTRRPSAKSLPSDE